MFGHLETGAEIAPWRALPGDTGPEQIFAIGDVHGRDRAFAAVLARIRATPRALGRARRLVLLGDLVDRGPGGLAALDLAARAAELAGVDRVDALPGNHELMLVEGLLDHHCLPLWHANGGEAVIDEAEEFLGVRCPRLPEVAAWLAPLLPADLLEGWRHGPGHLRIGDLLFVHAGIDPEEDVETFLGRDRFDVPDDERHWAWIRHPFLSHADGWDREGRLVVVHGHSPWLRRRADAETLERGALRIADRRRINLDAGAAVCGQVAWAEFLDGRARAGVVFTGTR